MSQVNDALKMHLEEACRHLINALDLMPGEQSRQKNEINVALAYIRGAMPPEKCGECGADVNGKTYECQNGHRWIPF